MTEFDNQNRFKGDGDFVYALYKLESPVSGLRVYIELQT